MKFWYLWSQFKIENFTEYFDEWDVYNECNISNFVENKEAE